MATENSDCIQAIGLSSAMPPDDSANGRLGSLILCIESEDRGIDARPVHLRNMVQ